ncbi:MAG: chromosome partitioning protein ParB [Candidatus Omnitrophica bacterium CG12_big_fil_rev_8_21_14_0_65_43_15]|uniref:Chromosome partitioning protein ParB n=1 Tax=Candidatus Taenaricola geysiri TaxID=1974752 RepID=A0A2J0LFP7_9BACT|nr:MAG: hypothetical protein AUJ89_02340 [Candidatus Omnitrophica bacterium CG1_02_43_210]PIV12297.1 MAG: chromosome partitioning protein ParB [Candidatus Omnitrophica bacterium CG03_land_8_20_14_0_80_43_22]PIW66678.1 MAG: chromosome partitioning protein ParB [Candidatus Omnitrophica bacterium CG12_big_fil_rev_8_21_14_0_65_43_15]PIW79941.1 MAG: chromosome partitioning protein ParB [Candidatus Omnitrophica bacterium CG_4_8_14_3_um_filter_43_15]PIY83887.1 MAG: chromosome partitioning protein ParB
MTERKALGKGLAALIPQSSIDQDSLRDDTKSRMKYFVEEKGLREGKNVISIAVDAIRPNRFQPRKVFKDDKLNELAESIKQKGILQPILVRPLGEDGFELLAGERRWRASKLAGLRIIPAIIKDTFDSDALEVSLIENLQRDDLNPMEESRAYKKMMDDFGFDLEKISKAVGKAVSSVSNTLRLLALPQKVQEAILSSEISAGHAKAILSLKDIAAQERLCKKIIENNLSVREAERLASGAKTVVITRQPAKKDIQITSLEEQLQRALGTKVKILPSKKGGKMVAQYFSNTDLERIIDLITRGARK